MDPHKRHRSKKGRRVLRITSWCFGLCLLVAACGSTLRAQTINAAGCDPASVQHALNSASQATATVIIPTGTCAWTSAISYTVPSAVTSLTIQGQTSVDCTGTPGTSGYACTAADNTVIQDDSTSSSSILVITTGGPSSVFRITGITLEPYSSSTVAKSNGIFTFYGTTSNFRWDHSHIVLNGNDNAGPEWIGQIEGVIDHNLLSLGGQSDYTNGIRNDNNLFDSVGNGDGSWMTSTQWGSQHFLFIEANYIIGGYTGDCDNAARTVIRYNTFSNAQDASGAVHSTKDYGGPARGCRALEFYHNYMSGSGVDYAATGGEGSSLIEWGNTLGNLSDNFFWAGGLYRNSTTVNGEPQNASPPNGWGYCGSTVAGHFNTSGTGTSTWDANSNTATGYPCLDGLGRGQQQDAMNGANFPSRANASTSGQQWPNQYLEPIYFWMNTLPSGMSGEANLTDVSTAFNRDLYYDCGSYNSACSSGFTGAAGTGFGTLASRPSTCTPGPGGTLGQSPTGSYGVAYWATDANSGNGELYVCTSTNNWTGIYSPYQYPHPLTSGTTSAPSSSSNAPAPPTGLSATVQ